MGRPFPVAPLRTLPPAAVEALHPRLPAPGGMLPALVLAVGPCLSACGSEAGAAAGWAGMIDTLATGQVVVTNPTEPVWAEGEEWTVVEELRIGALDDPGPYQFGEIRALEVDALGRIWVLESQAAELRVFDAEGRHVRTVGRQGGGPGEFAGPAHIAFGPDGHLWVPDPQNNRISVIDTTGAFLEAHRMDGGFFILPWPGGFDRDGRYYVPTPGLEAEGFGFGIVRYGPAFVALDTLRPPEDRVERDRFELVSADGGSRMMAGVPFTPAFRWRLSPRGTRWGLLTGPYRLFELDADGDTIRTIQTRYEPLPVTEADREAAREGLSWFTDQGGRIDLSRIPDRKPAAGPPGFFFDDASRIWVARMTDRPGGQDFDVFDPDGRRLGGITLPVPFPSTLIVRGDRIYGVTESELGVPHVVRARIDTEG